MREIAKKEAARIRLSRSRSTDLGSFITGLSRDYHEPEHLRPLLDELGRAEREKVRFCFSVPPRHGKSETLLHYVAMVLANDPSTRIGYCSHTHSFAVKQSKRARQLARDAGVDIPQFVGRADDWQTTAGGGLVARGVGGELTGRGFDILIVDDPIKSRAVAESSSQRDSVYDWFTSDAFTRLTPDGSIIVVHTRWHPDDLVGRLVSDGWGFVNLKAIDGKGEALWADGGWTADVLAERRRHVGEYNWASLYQGEPRPRGGQVFGEPSFYDRLPERYQCAYGIDLAYTKKTNADYSVCVKLLKSGDCYYVADVVRKQVDAPAFALTLKAMAAGTPGRMLWHASGTEKGAAQFLQQRIKRLEVANASTDKFVRSQGVAAAWNDGRVLVPDDAPWLDVFLGEMADFTGLDDAHDDQVDALASGFTALAVSSSAYRDTRRARKSMPQRRM